MSVLEYARLRVSNAETMEGALQPALAVLAAGVGCLGAEGYRCIERPDEFVFAVRWESVAAHEAFRASPQFGAYRSHLQDLLIGVPEYAHYVLVGRAVPTS